jgi:hypothetical protein
MPARKPFWDPYTRDPYEVEEEQKLPESEEEKLLKRLEKLADETSDLVSDKPKKGKK